MHCVFEIFNLLVASVSLGLLSLTSSWEVGKVPVAPSPHVSSISTPWQLQSTRSSLLFTNTTDGFVCDGARHAQERSSVWMFIFDLCDSVSSSLGAPQPILLRATIIILAALSFCTAARLGFNSWIRAAMHLSCSVHSRPTGREFNPKTVSSPDGQAKSGCEWRVNPGDCFPLVIKSQTAQVSQASKIDKSNPPQTNDDSREISATKTQDKIQQQQFLQGVSGRSMPTLQFSASNKPVRSALQQPSSIIKPGRLSLLQRPNVSGGLVPLQRPHQPGGYEAAGRGQLKKQSSQGNPSERPVANQQVSLLKPTGSISLKQSSPNNLYGSPVFIQKPPKPIGLTFRDSIPLNALQCKGYGRFNQLVKQPSLLPTGSLMQSEQQLNNLTPNAQEGSRLAPLTGQKTRKSSQHNGFDKPLLTQQPPKPIGLKFRDSIPLNALQLKGYRGLFIAQN